MLQKMMNFEDTSMAKLGGGKRKINMNDKTDLDARVNNILYKIRIH